MPGSVERREFRLDPYYEAQISSVDRVVIFRALTKWLSQYVQNIEAVINNDDGFIENVTIGGISSVSQELDDLFAKLDSYSERSVYASLSMTAYRSDNTILFHWIEGGFYSAFLDDDEFDQMREFLRNIDAPENLLYPEGSEISSQYVRSVHGHRFLATRKFSPGEMNNKPSEDFDRLSLVDFSFMFEKFRNTSIELEQIIDVISAMIHSNRGDYSDMDMMRFHLAKIILGSFAVNTENAPVSLVTQLKLSRDVIDTILNLISDTNDAQTTLR